MPDVCVMLFDPAPDHGKVSKERRRIKLYLHFNTSTALV